MSLKISKDLALPVDAITQTFAILAMRRIGKTYTASVMAEEFVKASLPFVALDPTGAWWGLRAGADGISEGLPVVIIGGEHGDVPLESTAGKVIADLVVDHPGFYVIDLSSTESNAEQDRFAMDFAERLYRRKNKARTPLHLFIDEADAFAPQRPLPGQQRMLGALEALVRRGGIRGIGTTLITQRPAILNKNVLTQSECLIVLQMNAPQDQDAIDDWVQRNGTKEQRDIMMQSLASLQQGEAWFWSPGWLRTFKKIRIRPRKTFNSSATPRAGEKVIVPQKLAPVDLDKLGKEIAATIERATENDPAVLKRKVGELKQKVQKLEQQAAQPRAHPPAQVQIKTIEIPVLTDDDRDLLDSIEQKLAEADEKLARFRENNSEIAVLRTDFHVFAQELSRRMNQVKIPAPIMPKGPALPKPVVPLLPRNPPSPARDGEIKLTRCAMSILAVLLSYPDGRTRGQTALLSGYSVTSSTFGNGLTELSKAKALIRSGDNLRAYPEAVELIPDFKPLPTGDALRDHWLSKLGGAPRHFFAYLLKRYPEFSTREEIAEATNYRITSSTFGNALTSLRAPDLIEEDQESNLRANPTLFET